MFWGNDRLVLVSHLLMTRTEESSYVGVLGCRCTSLAICRVLCVASSPDCFISCSEAKRHGWRERGRVLRRRALGVVSGCRFDRSWARCTRRRALGDHPARRELQPARPVTGSRADRVGSPPLSPVSPRSGRFASSMRRCTSAQLTDTRHRQCARVSQWHGRCFRGHGCHFRCPTAWDDSARIPSRPAPVECPNAEREPKWNATSWLPS